MALDIKDKRLLYELEKNARVTNAAIAKKIGLSKDAVAYRIRQLEKQGIIKGYRAIININALGYQTFRVYLRLIDMTQQAQQDMIDFLVKNKQTWWIAQLDGSWDFLFAYHAHSSNDFKAFYKEFLTCFRQHIKEKMISPITFYRELPRRYLVDSNERITFKSSPARALDKLDKSLLSILAINGRITLLELSKRIGADVKTIRTHICSLESQGVILGYKVDIDVLLLGRDFYTVEIDLNSFEEYETIQEELFSLPELTSWVESIGGYDLEFDMEIDKTSRYHDIIRHFKSTYPSIREIRYFRILKTHKIQYVAQD